MEGRRGGVVEERVVRVCVRACVRACVCTHLVYVPISCMYSHSVCVCTYLLYAPTSYMYPPLVYACLHISCMHSNLSLI